MNTSFIKTLSIAAVGLTVFAGSASAGVSDRAYYEQNKASLISQDKASAIATAHIKNSTVIKTDFEYDDGVAYYEVKVKDAQGSRHEVVVDAKTGQVLDSELDD